MNDKNLDFNKSITEKEISGKMNIPIYSPEKIDWDENHRVFGKFPNLFMSDDIDVHEGSYALNIKQHHWNNPSIPDDDVVDCIEHITNVFFNLAEKISKDFGFSGINLGGRSGGWLYLVSERNGRFSVIQGILDENLSFDEYFLQERILACFNAIKDIQRDLIWIYKKSSSFEDIHNNTERYIYG